MSCLKYIGKFVTWLFGGGLIAFNILAHFRHVLKGDVEDMSDTTIRSDYMAIGLAQYNAIMAATYTITSDTVGDSVADMAIAWLSAAIRYSEDHPENMSRQGGLHEWEMYRQNGYEVMAMQDSSKFDREKGNNLWIPKLREEVLVKVARVDNARSTNEV